MARHRLLPPVESDSVLGSISYGNRFIPWSDESIRGPEREFCVDNLLVPIHFIIEMIRWTGLASWDFEFPFPGSFIST